MARFKVETYVDQKLRQQIEVLTEVKDENPQKEFIGSSVLDHPAMGQVPFQFPIPAENIDDAFDKFKEIEEQKKKEIEKQIEDHINSRKILTPSGNPASGQIQFPGR